MGAFRIAVVIALAGLVIGHEASASDDITIATGGASHLSRSGEWLLYPDRTGSLHRHNLRTGEDDNIGGPGQLITDDGDMTCFDTKDRLVFADRDRRPDVYCRRISSGSLRLITTGNGRYVLLDMDASGRTIVYGRGQGFAKVRPFIFDWFTGKIRAIGPASTRMFVFHNPLLFDFVAVERGDPSATSVLGFDDVVDLSDDGRQFLFTTLNRTTFLYDRDTHTAKELPGIGALSGDGTVGITWTSDGVQRTTLATGESTHQSSPSPPAEYDVVTLPSSDGRFVLLSGQPSPVSMTDPPSELVDRNFLFLLDGETGEVTDLRDGDRCQGTAALSSDGAVVLSEGCGRADLRVLQG